MTIYQPREDSHQLLKSLKQFLKDNPEYNSDNISLLDMGTGSAFIPESIIKDPDVAIIDITASDINPEAIKESKNIKFIHSDLFENIKGRFDIITFNPPYLPDEEDDYDIALYGGKEGYELIGKFLNEAKNHLNENGVILLLFSTFSKPEKIFKELDENHYNYEKISEESHFFEQLYVYLIK